MDRTKPNDSPWVLCVLLSTAVLGAMVQLAILPSLPRMSLVFSSVSARADGTMIAQLVTTIAAPGMFCGAPAAGWLADRFGKRTVFLYAALLYALSGVLGAVAPNLDILLASRFVVGVAGGGVSAIGVALIGEVRPVTRRNRLLGWYSFTGSAGAFFVLLAAGALSEVNWKLPFVLYLAGLVTLGVGFVAIGKTEPAAVQAQPEAGSLRPALAYFLLLLVMSLVMYMASIQGPFLLVSWGTIAPTSQAIFADSITVGGLMGAYLFGKLRPMFAFPVLAAAIWMLFGLSTLGLGLTGNFAVDLLCGLLCGLGGGLLAPLMKGAVLDAVSPPVAGRAVGLIVGCLFLGQFTQPFAMAPLRLVFGIQQTFLAVGLAAFAVGLVLLLRAILVRGIRVASA